MAAKPSTVAAFLTQLLCTERGPQTVRTAIAIEKGIWERLAARDLAALPDTTVVGLVCGVDAAVNRAVAHRWSASVSEDDRSMSTVEAMLCDPDRAGGAMLLHFAAIMMTEPDVPATLYKRWSIEAGAYALWSALSVEYVRRLGRRPVDRALLRLAVPGASHEAPFGILQNLARGVGTPVAPWSADDVLHDELPALLKDIRHALDDESVRGLAELQAIRGRYGAVLRTKLHQGTIDLVRRERVRDHAPYLEAEGDGAAATIVPAHLRRDVFSMVFMMHGQEQAILDALGPHGIEIVQAVAHCGEHDVIGLARELRITVAEVRRALKTLRARPELLQGL